MQKNPGKRRGQKEERFFLDWREKRFKTKLRKKKEKEKLMILDPAWGNQMRIQILGDSNLTVNWMNGKWKINNQNFRAMVQKTRNMMDKTDMRPYGEITWTCSSTSPEIGIRKLIVFRMWQEKKGPHGSCEEFL